MDANFFNYSIYDRIIQRQPCVHVCVCAFVNFFLKKKKKTSPQKLLTGLLPNFTVVMEVEIFSSS